MFFQDSGDHVILEIADNFMQEVVKLNEGTEWTDSKKHKGKTLVEIKDKAVHSGTAEKECTWTLDLCKATTAIPFTGLFIDASCKFTV